MVTMNYVPDDSVVDFIRQHEGERLEVYADPVGLLTAGVGHLLTEEELKTFKLGDKITEEQSRKWLREDMQKAIDCVKAVKAPLTRSQAAALVSFVFNVGTGAFNRSSLKRLLEQGKFSLAAQEFKRWSKAKGKVLPGLVTRRDAERQLFLKGEHEFPISDADQKGNSK